MGLLTPFIASLVLPRPCERGNPVYGVLDDIPPPVPMPLSPWMSERKSVLVCGRSQSVHFPFPEVPLSVFSDLLTFAIG